MDDDTRAAFGRIDRYFELHEDRFNRIDRAFELSQDRFNRIDSILERHDERFNRIDRYFELNQVQFEALRGDVRELRGDVTANSEGIEGLRSELRSLRDWVEASLARIRAELRALTVRVARIEQRLDDTPRW